MLTAGSFADGKLDLPEAGRWHELVGGELVQLDPPEMAHGNAVLNLSRALAVHLQDAGDAYACFELGLVVARDPDTVRCPAISVFTEGEPFAESDRLVTETRPALVVEIASGRQRRNDMPVRVQELLDWGVTCIWIVDPDDNRVHTVVADKGRTRLAGHETLKGAPVLPGFSITVAGVFVEPEWWTGR